MIDISKVSLIRAVTTGACKLLFPAHFKEWEYLVNAYKRLLIESSRDHGKTMFFSVLYPLSKCLRGKNLEICIVSYSEEKSKSIITKWSDFITGREVLKTMKPDNSDKSWSKTELNLVGNNTVVARGFGTSGRGGHYDIVIVDDPIKDFGGMSSEDQRTYFTNVIVPTVKPDGQLIVVGTPVYDGDLLEYLENHNAYHKELFPALKDGKPLWPERYDIHILDERRREMGETAYSKEYLLQRVSPSTAFFKKDWFKFYDEAPGITNKVLSVDPAISVNGDYTALVLTGTDEGNRTYVLDYANMQTDSIQLILDRLFTMVAMWDVRFVMIETIGFQRLLKHWIHEEMRKRNEWFGLEEIRHHARTKQARIMSLQPRIQSGSLLFKKGQHEMLQQLIAFPRGKNDDLIDALCMQVGQWDQPVREAQSVPENSWDWWSGKFDNKIGDYRETMFQDLNKPDYPTGLTILH